MTSPFVGPGQHIQRLRRAYRTYTDQHGRTFGAVAELSNNLPIGELAPVGCMPPWLPPMRFAKFRRDGDNTFVWQYESMAAELAGITAEKYSDYRKFALREKLPVPEVGGVVDSLIRDALGEPPLSPAVPLACAQGDPWILGIAGAPPNVYLQEILEQGTASSSSEALDFIRAQLTANAAAHAIPLVATQAIPADVSTRVRSINDLDEHTALADMAALTYPQFVAQCAGRKMSMPDIAALWRTHKAALAEALAVGA